MSNIDLEKKIPVALTCNEADPIKQYNCLNTLKGYYQQIIDYNQSYLDGKLATSPERSIDGNNSLNSEYNYWVGQRDGFGNLLNNCIKFSILGSPICGESSALAFVVNSNSLIAQEKSEIANAKDKINNIITPAMKTIEGSPTYKSDLTKHKVINNIIIALVVIAVIALLYWLYKRYVAKSA